MSIHNNRLYVDNTTLVAFANCKFKAVMRGVWGRQAKEDSVHLELGKSVHSALHKHFQGAKPADVLQVFANEYKEWAEANVAPDHGKAYPNAYRIFDHYLIDRPLTAFSFRFDPDHVEAGYAAPLGIRTPRLGNPEVHGIDRLDIWYYCRPDAVVWDDKDCYVLDSKTTSRLAKGWSDAYRAGSQATGQVWCVGKALGRPIVGAFINGLEFKPIPSSTTKCKVHKKPYHECGIAHVGKELVGPFTRTETEIKQWLQATRSLAEEWAAWAVYGQANGVEGALHCPITGRYTGECTAFQSQCQYTDFCAGGRPMHLVEQFTTPGKWEPWTEGNVRHADDEQVGAVGQANDERV